MSNEFLLTRQKATILECISDMRQVFTSVDEQEDIGLILFFFNRLHPTRIMNMVVDHVLPLKDHVKKRDATFFVKNKQMYAGLPPDRIKHYTSPKIIDQIGDDVEPLFQYFDIMISLAEQYKKQG
jgi:hypothetical protein